MATQIRTTRFHDGQDEGLFVTTHDDLPELAEGDIKIAMSYLSIDPAMRGWASNKRSYMPPVQPGQVMRAFGVAQVVESRSKYFEKDDWVTGFLGAQSEAVINQRHARKIDTRYAEPKDYLAGLGMTGYTAYFGMKDLGKPKAGETVVVSAASGAVGAIAAQIAKLQGARVVGVAGGEVKCAYLKDELKLDAVIDYKQGNLQGQFKEACPSGIDLYFDNVGGEILETVLAQINYQGRIVVCGQISQYGDMGAAKGPSNFMSIIAQSVSMRGFTMKDFMHRVPEALMYLVQARREGSIIMRDHVIEGLDRFEEGFSMIYQGKNHGKLLIKV